MNMRAKIPNAGPLVAIGGAEDKTSEAEHPAPGDLSV